MKNVNLFKDKTKFEIQIESLLYADRKKFLGTGLSDEAAMRVREIQENGFTVIPDFVSKERLKELKTVFQTSLEKADFEMPCLGQNLVDEEKHKENIKGYLLGNGQQLKKQGLAFDKEDFKSLDQVVNDFAPSTLKSYYKKDNPLFFDTMLSPLVQEVLEGYMGIKPYLIEGYTRRNFPGKFMVMNHHWHRDTNHRTFLCKAFLFLTDCDTSTGPHQYFKGTHKDYTLNGKQYYTDDEVFGTYGDRQLVNSEVKAGTLVIEDTRGIHRAGLPVKDFRDVIYGVFFPVSFLSSWQNSYYQINTNTYEQLTPKQRSYIPKNCIVNG